MRAGKRARFQIFFIGSPKGADVSVIAEPGAKLDVDTRDRDPHPRARRTRRAVRALRRRARARSALLRQLRTAPRRAPVEYQELLADGAQGAAAIGATEQPPVHAAAVATPPPGAGDTRTVSPLGAAVAIGLLLLAVLLGAVIGRGGDTRTPAPVVVGAAAAGATAAFQSDWTGDGWTIRLVVLPKTSTQPAQVAAAKADARARAPRTSGALDADTFVSLPGGSYVIYSGPDYDTQAQAQAALQGVKASFPDATVVEVSTTAAAGGAAAGATKGASGDGSSSGSAAPKPSAAKKSAPTPSTQNYIQKSKKLPDKVGTGGKPPPTDNKAPGGGSQGTTIG